MKEVFDIKFRKAHRLEHFLMVLALSCFFVLTSVYASYTIENDYRKAKNKNIQEFTASVSNYFVNLDNLYTLILRDSMISDFKILNREEFSSVSPSQIISAKETLRYYDAIMCIYGKTNLYFKKSETFFGASGTFDEIDFYSEFQIGAQARSEIEASLQENQTFKRIIPEEGQVFYLQHSHVNSAYLIVCIPKNIFTEFVSTFFEPQEGVKVFFEDQEFFSSGSQNSKKYFVSEIKNLQITAFYYPLQNIQFVLLSIGSLFLIWFVIYLLLNYVVERMVNNYYSKIQKITLEKEFNIDSKSATALSFIQNYIVEKESKEQFLQNIIRQDKEKIRDLCLSMLINGEYGENAEKILSLLDISNSSFNTIYVTEKVNFQENFTKIADGVWWSTEQELKKLDCRCGVSNAYRSLTELQNAFKEARSAYMLACLFELDSVVYIDISVEKQDAFEKIFRELRETNKPEDKLKLVDRFSELCLQLKLNISVVKAIKQWEEFFSDINSEYNLGVNVYLPKNINLQKLCDVLRDYILQFDELLQAKLDNKFAQIFLNIRNYVNENLFDENLSLKKIANHFNYSVSYISRIFSENGEENYNEYINKNRIELAKKLLLTNKTVMEISHLCGFNSDISFRRVFIKYVKMTPNQYRALKM